MPTWLEAISSPLKSATETLQKLMEARELLKYGDTFRKLHGEILAAQASATSGYQRELDMLKKVSALEAKVAGFENWERQKQRYQAKQFDPGITVYELKADMAEGEPIHHACPNCYAEGKARILQGTDKVLYRRRVRVCNACKSEFAYGPESPTPMTRTVDNGCSSWIRARR